MESNKSPNEIIQELRQKRKNKISVKKVNNNNKHSSNFVQRKPILKRREYDRTKFKKINRRNNSNPRLFITNLSPKTSNYDLKQKFEKIGNLKRCGIHWNEVGQSKGTADIEFFNPSHAETAVRLYNNSLSLHGRVLSVIFSKITTERKRLGFKRENFTKNKIHDGKRNLRKFNLRRTKRN